MNRFLFILILIIFTTADYLNAQDEKKVYEAQSNFEVKIISSISISEDISTVPLGAISPGETKLFESSKNSVVFTIQGQKNKEVTFSGRIYSNTDSVNIKELAWEYYDGNDWRSLLIYSTTNDQVNFENFNYELNDNGQILIRAYPKKLSADKNIKAGKRYVFSLSLTCYYTDF